MSTSKGVSKPRKRKTGVSKKSTLTLLDDVRRENLSHKESQEVPITKKKLMSKHEQETATLGAMFWEMFSELEFQETRTLHRVLADFRIMLCNRLAEETKRDCEVIWSHLPRAVSEAWCMYRGGAGVASYDTFIRILTTPPVITIMIEQPKKEVPVEVTEVIIEELIKEEPIPEQPMLEEPIPEQPTPLVEA